MSSRSTGRSRSRSGVSASGSSRRCPLRYRRGRLGTVASPYRSHRCAHLSPWRTLPMSDLLDNTNICSIYWAAALARANRWLRHRVPKVTVGRNAAIKALNATPWVSRSSFRDQTLAASGFVELLKSPWIVRASDLARRDGVLAAKRPTSRSRSSGTGTGVRRAFVRGTTPPVDAVVQAWATEGLVGPAAPSD